MVQSEYNMADKRIKAFILLALIIGMMILARHLMGQQFSSVDDLRQYMRGLGILAPMFLTVFQAFQVIVPVVPGYLGCAAGAIAFGTPIGFVCNYIGISCGSIIAYFLARRYGLPIVLMMFSQSSTASGKRESGVKNHMMCFYSLRLCCLCFQMISCAIFPG